MRRNWLDRIGPNLATGIALILWYYTRPSLWALVPLWMAMLAAGAVASLWLDEMRNRRMTQQTPASTKDTEVEQLARRVFLAATERRGFRPSAVYRMLGMYQAAQSGLEATRGTDLEDRARGRLDASQRMVEALAAGFGVLTNPDNSGEERLPRWPFAGKSN